MGEKALKSIYPMLPHEQNNIYHNLYVYMNAYVTCMCNGHVCVCIHVQTCITYLWKGTEETETLGYPQGGELGGWEEG